MRYLEAERAELRVLQLKRRRSHDTDPQTHAHRDNIGGVMASLQLDPYDHCLMPGIDSKHSHLFFMRMRPEMVEFIADRHRSNPFFAVQLVHWYRGGGIKTMHRVFEVFIKKLSTLPGLRSYILACSGFLGYFGLVWGQISHSHSVLGSRQNAGWSDRGRLGPAQNRISEVGR